ncbi:MAG: cation:proton antiporter [Methanoregulaceae archaeon]
MEGIAIALLVCLILAIVTRYLSIPPTPFYILAGLLIGKAGLNLVGASELSDFITNLGLLFLLFFMGLELKPGKILANGSSFFISGIIDLNINMLIGVAAAYALGFGFTEALVVGAAFYISSTAMALASLIENRKLILRESETVVWLMIFEDLVLLVFLAMLSSSGQNPVLMIVEILAMFGLFYAIVHWGKEIIVDILDRDDELPVLFTFTAVVITAGFSATIGIPETLMVIALGVALSSTDPVAFEQNARPFKDVFLILFFVFFGISVDLSGGASLLMIVIISGLALLSKLISGILIGKAVHRSAISGVEIWANTTGRGEFSIALASLYGSPIVSTTVAAMVIVTSLVGSFASKYSNRLKKAFGKIGKGRGLPRLSSRI